MIKSRICCLRRRYLSHPHHGLSPLSGSDVMSSSVPAARHVTRISRSDKTQSPKCIIASSTSSSFNDQINQHTLWFQPHEHSWTIHTSLSIVLRLIITATAQHPDRRERSTSPIETSLSPPLCFCLSVSLSSLFDLPPSLPLLTFPRWLPRH